MPERATAFIRVIGMRRLATICAGLASILEFAGAASAADLPAKVYAKAAPVVAPVYNWGGFYLGLNGGGGSSRNCWTGGVPAPTGLGCHDATGGLAGGQIGYRWQATNWVFGIEAQGDWANLRGSNTRAIGTFGGVPFADQTKIDSIALFTGQVGYAWNNVLAYVKGGAALTHDKYAGISNATVPATGGGVGVGPGDAFSRASETRLGGVIGAGIEFGFAPQWSIAVEYDHLFMGKHNLDFVAIPAFGGGLLYTDGIKQDVDMITVRVNYTFGGPVVAKY
jgi:outer membrane immunogenic protein